MKFYRTPKPTIHLGDRRVIKIFALYPVRIENETRWLETVKIEEERCQDKDDREHWNPILFADNDRIAEDRVLISIFEGIFVTIVLLVVLFGLYSVLAHLLR